MVGAIRREKQRRRRSKSVRKKKNFNNLVKLRELKEKGASVSKAIQQLQGEPIVQLERMDYNSTMYSGQQRSDCRSSEGHSRQYDYSNYNNQNSSYIPSYNHNNYYENQQQYSWQRTDRRRYSDYNNWRMNNRRYRPYQNLLQLPQHSSASSDTLYDNSERTNTYDSSKRNGKDSNKYFQRNNSNKENNRTPSLTSSNIPERIQDEGSTSEQLGDLDAASKTKEPNKTDTLERRPSISKDSETTALSIEQVNTKETGTLCDKSLDPCNNREFLSSFVDLVTCVANTDENKESTALNQSEDHLLLSNELGVIELEVEIRSQSELETTSNLNSSFNESTEMDILDSDTETVCLDETEFNEVTASDINTGLSYLDWEDTAKNNTSTVIEAQHPKISLENEQISTVNTNSIDLELHGGKRKREIANSTNSAKIPKLSEKTESKEDNPETNSDNTSIAQNSNASKLNSSQTESVKCAKINKRRKTVGTAENIKCAKINKRRKTGNTVENKKSNDINRARKMRSKSVDLSPERAVSPIFTNRRVTRSMSTVLGLGCDTLPLKFREHSKICSRGSRSRSLSRCLISKENSHNSPKRRGRSIKRDSSTGEDSDVSSVSYKSSSSEQKPRRYKRNYTSKGRISKSMITETDENLNKPSCSGQSKATSSGSPQTSKESTGGDNKSGFVRLKEYVQKETVQRSRRVENHINFLFGLYHSDHSDDNDNCNHSSTPRENYTYSPELNSDSSNYSLVKDVSQYASTSKVSKQSVPFSSKPKTYSLELNSDFSNYSPVKDVSQSASTSMVSKQSVPSSSKPKTDQNPKISPWDYTLRATGFANKLEVSTTNDTEHLKKNISKRPSLDSDRKIAKSIEQRRSSAAPQISTNHANDQKSTEKRLAERRSSSGKENENKNTCDKKLEIKNSKRRTSTVERREQISSRRNSTDHRRLSTERRKSITMERKEPPVKQKLHSATISNLPEVIFEKVRFLKADVPESKTGRPIIRNTRKTRLHSVTVMPLITIFDRFVMKQNIKASQNGANKGGNASQNEANQVGNTSQNEANQVGNASQNEANLVGDTSQNEANQVENVLQNEANQVENVSQNEANQVGNVSQNQVGNVSQNEANKVGNESQNEASKVGNALQNEADKVGNASQNEANQVENTSQNEANQVVKAHQNPEQNTDVIDLCSDDENDNEQIKRLEFVNSLMRNSLKGQIGDCKPILKSDNLEETTIIANAAVSSLSNTIPEDCGTNVNPENKEHTVALSIPDTASLEPIEIPVVVNNSTTDQTTLNDIHQVINDIQVLNNLSNNAVKFTISNCSKDGGRRPSTDALSVEKDNRNVHSKQNSSTACGQLTITPVQQKQVNDQSTANKATSVIDPSTSSVTRLERTVSVITQPASAVSDSSAKFAKPVQQPKINRSLSEVSITPIIGEMGSNNRTAHLESVNPPMLTSTPAVVEQSVLSPNVTVVNQSVMLPRVMAINHSVIPPNQSVVPPNITVVNSSVPPPANVIMPAPNIQPVNNATIITTNTNYSSQAYIRPVVNKITYSDFSNKITLSLLINIDTILMISECIDTYKRLGLNNAQIQSEFRILKSVVPSKLQDFGATLVQYLQKNEIVNFNLKMLLYVMHDATRGRFNRVNITASLILHCLFEALQIFETTCRADVGFLKTFYLNIISVWSSYANQNHKQHTALQQTNDKNPRMTYIQQVQFYQQCHQYWQIYNSPHGIPPHQPLQRQTHRRNAATVHQAHLQQSNTSRYQTLPTSQLQQKVPSLQSLVNNRQSMPSQNLNTTQSTVPLERVAVTSTYYVPPPNYPYSQTTAVASTVVPPPRENHSSQTNKQSRSLLHSMLHPQTYHASAEQAQTRAQAETDATFNRYPNDEFRIRLPLSKPYEPPTTSANADSSSTLGDCVETIIRQSLDAGVTSSSNQNNSSQHTNEIKPEAENEDVIDVEKWFDENMKDGDDVICLNPEFFYNTNIKVDYDQLIKADVDAVASTSGNPEHEQAAQTLPVGEIGQPIVQQQMMDPMPPRIASVDSGFSSPHRQIEHPEILSGERTCICWKKAELVCQCRLAIYCSTSCQRKDWINHREQCITARESNRQYDCFH